MPQGKAEAKVLKGPKHPEWCCSLCQTGNWASRVECRQCARHAPRSTYLAARKAHEQALKEKNQGCSASGGRKHSGGHAKGVSDYAKMQKQIQDLQAINERLQEKVEGLVQPVQPKSPDAEGDDPMEEQGLPSLESLRKLQAANEEAYGKESPQARASAQEVERVRKLKAEARPVLTQVQIAQRAVEKQKKLVKALEVSHAKLEQELEAIQEQIKDSAAELEQAKAEEKAAEEEAQAVCRKVLPQGGQAAAQPPEFNLEVMLGAIRSKAALAEAVEGGPQRLELATKTIEEFVQFVNRLEAEKQAKEQEQQAQVQPAEGIPVPDEDGFSSPADFMEALSEAMTAEAMEMDPEKRKALARHMADAKRRKVPQQG